MEPKLKMNVTSVFCVIHISNLILRALKCSQEESEHIDLSNCTRELSLLVGHKREVASYRDRVEATCL